MFRIEEILKERGLTKKAFGDLIGTSKQNVNALLKNPTLNKLETIANALEIPIWQLFISEEDVVAKCSKPSYGDKSDFFAFFKQGDKYHHASSIIEAEEIIRKIKDGEM